MFNAYSVIIGLFIVAGLGSSLWASILIARARRTRNWPVTRGVIEISEPASEHDALLPRIVYRYTVDGATFRRTLEFPAGTTPTPELARSYVEKFPTGAHVDVFYNPAQPQQATLERGVAGGDWLVLAFGLGALLLGLIMLLL